MLRPICNKITGCQPYEIALEASAHALQVEVLLPEFWDPDAGPTFAEEGDQLRFWKLTRRFIEGIQRYSGLQQVRAVRQPPVPLVPPTSCVDLCPVQRR